MDLNGLEWTTMEYNGQIGNFVGITWEKLFFSWEKLGTFRFDIEIVIILFGNFVGITFFFVGITWEKLGEM